MTPQTPMLIYPTVPLSALPDHPASDTEQLAQRARQRVNFRIEISYKRALRDVRQDFAAARGRLGL